MKNIVIGTLSIILLIIVMLFSFSVYGRSVREQEINEGLNNAMKIAIEMIAEDKAYAPSSNDELISDFTQAFLMHINSSSTITIEVLDVDYKTGLLSVRVTSDYMHLTGTPGSVSMEKTIILEEYKNREDKNVFTISYYIDGLPYLETELEKDAVHNPPSSLPGYSGTLKGWKALSGSYAGTTYTVAQLKSLAVTEDVMYSAIIQ